MKPFTVDGKVYALPMREDTMLMYYNKNVFQEKNWKAPTNRDELEALATEAKGQGLIPIGGTNSTYGASSELACYVLLDHFAGGDAIYQALTGKVHWTESVFVDAIQLLPTISRRAGSEAPPRNTTQCRNARSAPSSVRARSPCIRGRVVHADSWASISARPRRTTTIGTGRRCLS